MKVRVLYFQALSAAARRAEETVDLPDGSSVECLLTRLAASHPDLAPVAAGLLCAVNEEHSPRDRPLKSGDVVALMPPFSGG